MSNGFPVTYMAAVTGLVPGAAASDIFTISGSASAVIRVQQVTISGIATTPASPDIVIAKRSTADTGGTATHPTAVPTDSTAGAASATLNAYTANPTLGTLVGNIMAEKAALAAAGTPSAPLTVNFVGNANTAGIALRSAAETLAVNLNAATLTGASIDVSIVWTEQ